MRMTGVFGMLAGDRDLTRRALLTVTGSIAGTALAMSKLVGGRLLTLEPAEADTSEAVEKNLQVEREGNDAWNAHDPDRHALLVSEDYLGEGDTLPVPTRGPEGYKRMMRVYLSAFPDLHIEVEQMLGVADFVITRWRATGTHQGELMGIRPTDRHADVHGCAVTKFREGKMAQAWTYWDRGRLLEQLGVLPGPKQG